MFIRSVIFLIAGLITFFFSKKLNDFKNDLLKKFGFKNKIKDETKGYYYLGLFFIVISIILFLISIENWHYAYGLVNLYCETLFLTFQAINMSKNWIGNLIKAALWLPMAGVLENTSQIWIGKNKSIKIKIPQAPIVSSFLKNNARPNKISNKPDKYIIAKVNGKNEGTKGI